MFKIEIFGEIVKIQLNDGYVIFGLMVLSVGLGICEIVMLDDIGDGEFKNQKFDDLESLVFVKYGIWFDGKQFVCVCFGGVM